MPFLMPNQQCQSSEWKNYYYYYYYYYCYKYIHTCSTDPVFFSHFRSDWVLQTSYKQRPYELLEWNIHYKQEVLPTI